MTIRKFSALALALALVFAAAAAARADGSDNSSALVKITQMKQGSLPVTVTAFGQVQPAASAKESITAPFGARVSVVDVQVGQRIAKGTPLVMVTPSLETKAAYKLAKDTLARTRSLAKAHLATAGDLAKAESDYSVLEEAGASGPNTLKAPYDAIVLKVDAAQGAVVARGDALIELAKPDGLVVQVGIDPGQAMSVKAGNAVALTPLSASAPPVEGKVALRSEVINADTGQVPVQIDFPAGKLLIGEIVRAVITAGEQSGFIVPHSAILVDDDGTVYVVQDVDGAGKKVAVEVLATKGDEDVIAGDDLDAKAPIVIEGGHEVDDGTKLRVAEAQGTAKGAGTK
ncbi:MAG: HlyD family efflux transporter periplasmic adaptor subunit [Alphaproteobacteria bacterium]|nr:HlyD family efflux transporter periplasmic adaptor subunit [Alphaproteobacteria bacterium]